MNGIYQISDIAKKEFNKAEDNNTAFFNCQVIYKVLSLTTHDEQGVEGENP